MASLPTTGDDDTALGKLVGQSPEAAEPPPMRFVGEVEPWWMYRRALIERCQEWHRGSPARVLQELLAEEVPRLFPPPAVSARTCSASRWRPADSGIIGSVIVTAGGVYGGSDGPAGMHDYVAAILHDISFLQLDTGHEPAVACAVLRAALEWLLATHPQTAGHIILCGFSMGSATVCEVGSEFLEAVQALLIFSGQAAGTEQISSFRGRPVLLVHGDGDVNVPVQCSYDLAARARAAEALVELEVMKQSPCNSDDALERMKRHHLWDERWEVQALVLDWLRARIREASRA